MTINFFDKGSNLQGQFNNLFASGQSNTIGSSLKSRYDINDDGLLELSSDLGDKEKVNKFLTGVREYVGQDKEEGFTEKMMSNPAFIMGLSLMKAASEGKNIGGALMPAAEATQGFITNQELRKNNQRLMKMKEGEFMIQALKDQQDFETTDLKNISTIINEIDFGKLNNISKELSIDISRYNFTQNKRNDRHTEEFIASLNGVSEEYKNLVIANPGFLNDIKSASEIETFKTMYDSAASPKAQSLLSGLKVSASDASQAFRLIDEQVISMALNLAAADGNRDPEAQDFIKAESIVFDGLGIKENGRLREWFTGNKYSISATSIDEILKGNRLGGKVFEGVPTIIGEDGPEVFVPETDGKILSNPKTAGGYTWEDAIIDSSEMLAKIKQSSGAEEAKKALKKFRPDLYI
jgi:hypothetical protein